MKGRLFSIVVEAIYQTGGFIRATPGLFALSALISFAGDRFGLLISQAEQAASPATQMAFAWAMTLATPLLQAPIFFAVHTRIVAGTTDLRRSFRSRAAVRFLMASSTVGLVIGLPFLCIAAAGLVVVGGGRILALGLLLAGLLAIPMTIFVAPRLLFSLPLAAACSPRPFALSYRLTRGAVGLIMTLSSMSALGIAIMHLAGAWAATLASWAPLGMALRLAAALGASFWTLLFPASLSVALVASGFRGDLDVQSTP